MPAPKKPAGQKQDRRGSRTEVGKSLELVKPAGAAVDSLVPAPPPGMLKGTIELWDSYWSSTVAQVAIEVDRLGVATRWIEAQDERRRAMTVFRKQRFVKGSMGQATLNPISAWIKSREEVIAKCEAELGLTPYARQRLGIAVGQAAMTAAQLNAMSEEPDHAPEDESGIIDLEEDDFGDFEEA